MASYFWKCLPGTGAANVSPLPCGVEMNKVVWSSAVSAARLGVPAGSSYGQGGTYRDRVRLRRTFRQVQRLQGGVPDHWCTMVNVVS